MRVYESGARIKAPPIMHIRIKTPPIMHIRIKTPLMVHIRIKPPLCMSNRQSSLTINMYTHTCTTVPG
jgi:hypothetical protein